VRRRSRAALPARIEPPLWYRAYYPAQWDEPDGQEQRMITGWFPGHPWPAELHAIHAERRWHEAKYLYRQQHPALASQEFSEIVNSEWAARRQERHG
jgi:hypothetical protein